MIRGEVSGLTGSILVRLKGFLSEQKVSSIQAADPPQALCSIDQNHANTSKRAKFLKSPKNWTYLDWNFHSGLNKFNLPILSTKRALYVVAFD